MFPEGSIHRRNITLDERNASSEDFNTIIWDKFPELLHNANVFSLWQLRGNDNSLVPLPEEINNAKALCHFKELNRSRVYIRPVVSSFALDSVDINSVLVTVFHQFYESESCLTMIVLVIV